MDRTATLREHQLALCTLLKEFDRVCRKLDIPYVLFAGTLLGAVRHEGFIPWDDDLDVMMLRADYDRFLREAPAVLDAEEFYLQGEFSEHWPMFFSKLRLNGTTCLEKFHPRDPLIHQGVYIDIFPCDNARNSRWGRKLQFAASKFVIAKSLYTRGYDTNSWKKKQFMAICRWLPSGIFLRMVKGGKEDSRLVHSFLGGASVYEKNIFERSFFQKRATLLFEGEFYPVPCDYEALLNVLYGDYVKLPEPEERLVKKHAILVDLEQSYEYYAHYRDDMVFDVHTRSIR